MSATLVAALPSVRRRFARVGDVGTMISGTVVVIVLLMALIGPWIAPYDPDATDVLGASQGISASHWLGTDSLGRDILSRALHGARLSVAGPALIVVLASGLGTALAILAAWNGGWVDRLITRAMNVVFSIPGILVAVLASAVFGVGFWAPVIALGVVYIPFVTRVVRSVAIVERRRGYVESLRLAGASPLRICVRHILPNVMPIVLAQATYGFGAALADFSAVSFLGLGVQPPASEWGVMVAEGRAELLNGAMMQSLVAGALIVATVVAFNILGAKISANDGGRR